MVQIYALVLVLFIFRLSARRPVLGFLDVFLGAPASSNFPTKLLSSITACITETNSDLVVFRFNFSSDVTFFFSILQERGRREEREIMPKTNIYIVYVMIFTCIIPKSIFKIYPWNNSLSVTKTLSILSTLKLFLYISDTIYLEKLMNEHITKYIRLRKWNNRILMDRKTMKTK